MEKKRNQKPHDKHHKHHKRPHDVFELYESEHTVGWLNDVPPRPTARVNSDRLKEKTPKAENRIVRDYWHANEDSTDRIRVIYDEDVDGEAAEFIKLEHDKAWTKQMDVCEGVLSLLNHQYLKGL
ncbi:Uncharacterized protein Adt_15855 [Abeliophyllum distichum]|uniref:Uncharacterized protein n=1 Tax=Abeliophyllum distichum TaxID=126358 RepID=A0ABD1U4D0_9LAMI